MMKFISKSNVLFLLLIIFSTKSFATHKIDSLQNLYNKTSQDSVKFDLTAKILNLYIKKGEYDGVFHQINQLDALSKKINRPHFTDTYFQLKAYYYYKLNQYDSAIVYDYKSIEVASQINHYVPLIKCYVNLGNIYNQKADYQKAISSFQQAEQYSLKSKDTLGRITTILNIGSTYYLISDYKQAKAHFKKIITLCEKNDKYLSELATAYNNIGTIYQNQEPKQYDSAMYYYVKFKGIEEHLGIQRHIALAHYNIGEVYRNKGNIEASLQNLSIAEEIYKKEDDKVGLAKICLCLGDIYMTQNKFNQAINVLKQGLEYSIICETISQTADFYKGISRAYYMAGRYKEAMDNYRMGVAIADSIYNAENSEILYEMRTKYETDEKEKQNKLLEAENIISSKTIKQQQLTTYIIVGGLVLTLLLAFFIFKGLRNQKKSNRIIEQQKLEVENQKALVEEHQKETLDSITYARRIQYALLAKDIILNNNLENYFVLFKPKDIVSGDFYWATESSNKFYLAVCDSTGHGVPGAFMSLLNIGFLSEAINEKEINLPNEVLNYVRERLISSIGVDGQKDGMDCILLCINKTTKEITYSAANNAPVLISKGMLVELEKDRMSVGKGESEDSFTLYQLDYSKGDMLYLYTDGYADQFGGPKGKKFKYKALNELLLKHSSLPMEEQRAKMELAFDTWKGNLEQIDDVCMIGIEL